jgi:hypothetical protein
MAPDSDRRGGDDSFHPPDAGILSTRSHRMLLEDPF